MKALAVVLYIAAATSEIGGFGLLIRDIRGLNRTARRWRQANPRQNNPTTWKQIEIVDEIVTSILSTPRRRVAAAALVLLGIATGTAGNLIATLA